MGVLLGFLPGPLEVECRQDGQGTLRRGSESCLGERGPGPLARNVRGEGTDVLPTEDNEVKAVVGFQAGEGDGGAMRRAEGHDTDTLVGSRTVGPGGSNISVLFLKVFLL